MYEKHLTEKEKFQGLAVSARRAWLFISPPPRRTGGREERRPAACHSWGATITAPGWEAGKEAPASPQLPTHLTQSMVGSYSVDRKHKLISLCSLDQAGRKGPGLFSHREATAGRGKRAHCPPPSHFFFYRHVTHVAGTCSSLCSSRSDSFPLYLAKSILLCC